MSNIILSTCNSLLNLDVLGIEHNENDLAYWLQTKGFEILPAPIFTASSVLFGLVDPLDIKALIEASLQEDARQTGLQHEEESCLEYLKRGGHLFMEEHMDRAQMEVSLFSTTIASLCEELDARCHPTLCRVDPKKLVTIKAVPTKAVQEKCYAWLRTSSQSQDITQDSSASRILHDFPLTSQCPCPHDHVLRPDNQFIPLPHVMKAWVDNFTYSAYTNMSLAEANAPLHPDHGNSFTAKESKSLNVLKSDFHILDLKKQRAQSEVDMLSEAIVRIAEFHHSDDGTTETDESDSLDDWMSTSSLSSSCWSL
ncbi:uncharacterized protein F5891DRAFT_1192057 [Suillus fuscotomentosus]|uniref:Uncharacterized protein n=1 Tax=Suillus fuscotomentosus TaxID=1912939 RepID=A0AAD4E2Z7_9AGAM|nr:uncharacterized protein F5891DRAFT_1192057 [Suillus fuscotomentosus]KAG1897348.1 hypothetical protein F5891DRAFT_1192057 [Suillus fuscotomentosus]